MTANRRAARFVPITWSSVRIPRMPYTAVSGAKAWCRETVGVERADWEYRYDRGTWRFRDPEMAFLFQLTWG